MASRAHSERSEGAVNRSGSLGQALTDHAYQRVIHFFLFVFALDALCRRLRTLGAPSTATPGRQFVVKATHQIDTGLRSDDPAYYGFPVNDPKVVTFFATACGRMDAAHFCNLGVAPGLGTLVGQAGGDQHVTDIYEFAKRLAGDTRLLPQQVNIGPDRIIDVLHGVLAAEFFAAGIPVVSTANLAAYLARATAAMTSYQAKKVQKGRLGIAACCQVYIDVYAAAGEALWQSLSGQVWAECGARPGILDRADYLHW